MANIPKWTGTLVGKMHNNNVSHGELATELGVTPDYVSMVLNGKRTPKGAKERFNQAFEEIVKSRQ